jgi:hypothetical protein
MKQTLVLAGNRKQFEDWLRQKFVFVQRPDDVRGRNADRIETVGTWYELRDSHELLLMAQTQIGEPQREVTTEDGISNCSVSATEASADKQDGAGLCIKCVEYSIKVRAADAMAKAIDDWVERGLLDSRSLLADARLNYGKPYTYEAAPEPSPRPQPTTVQEVAKWCNDMRTDELIGEHIQQIQSVYPLRLVAVVFHALQHFRSAPLPDVEGLVNKVVALVCGPNDWENDDLRAILSRALGQPDALEPKEVARRMYAHHQQEWNEKRNPKSVLTPILEPWEQTDQHNHDYWERMAVHALAVLRPAPPRALAGKEGQQ